MQQNMDCGHVQTKIHVNPFSLSCYALYHKFFNVFFTKEKENGNERGKALLKVRDCNQWNSSKTLCSRLIHIATPNEFFDGYLDQRMCEVSSVLYLSLFRSSLFRLVTIYGPYIHTPIQIKRTVHAQSMRNK